MSEIEVHIKLMSFPVLVNNHRLNDAALVICYRLHVAFRF